MRPFYCLLLSLWRREPRSAGCWAAVRAPVRSRRSTAFGFSSTRSSRSETRIAMRPRRLRRWKRLRWSGTGASKRESQELVEAKEALSSQFAEISNKLLAEAQETFLKRADQRFRQSEENAGQNLKALLQPVHERLERYETTVQKVEAERRDAFGMLSGQIEAMRTGTERVSAEAAKLVNALRNAPKARGRWGEQQLRNVLESCGLSEHCDFETEVSIAAEERGRLRPDVVIQVPGGQSLVIDGESLAECVPGCVRSSRRGRTRCPPRCWLLGNSCARQRTWRESLLVAVPRRTRLCRDVHSR